MTDEERKNRRGFSNPFLPQNVKRENVQLSAGGDFFPHLFVPSGGKKAAISNDIFFSSLAHTLFSRFSRKRKRKIKQGKGMDKNRLSFRQGGGVRGFPKPLI